MSNFIEQLKALRVSRYQVVLRAQRKTVLQAIIGSTLRGAFGHQWKAVVCQLPPGERGKCLVAKNCKQPGDCLYAGIFEPKYVDDNDKIEDAPRPFIFEPHIPPITRRLSESSDSTLKYGIFKGGKIAFGLTLFGRAINQLPYFIYAIELLAKQGIGGGRQPFNLAEIYSLDEIGNQYLIYTEKRTEIRNNCANSLAELVDQRLKEINLKDKLKIRFLLPLRLRSGKQLITDINFGQLFEYAWRRVDLMMKIYGQPVEFENDWLKEKAKEIKTIPKEYWEHDYDRWSEKQEKKLPLDGMLGEIEFEGESLAEFLPLFVAGEILHIGSATSFGLGKYEIIG